MSVESCIPTHKHDVPAAERARKLGFPSLKGAIPELLRWVQDADWPVAAPIASVLKNAGLEMVPHIRIILARRDAIWKYWLIVLVITESSQEVVEELADELSRLAFEPSKEDMLESVDTVAENVLHKRVL